MTNDEFLAEALNHPACPEHFTELYQYFCSYQQMAVNGLKEFSRICRKYAIEYQLGFGSLLGAVRDGGQIPWDYDVDVNVPYYERDRLLDAFDKELSKEFYYVTPEKDPTYRGSIDVLVPAGYMHQAIHVDIFYVIGLPENEIEREKYTKEVRDHVRARKYVAQDLSEYPYTFRSKMKQRLLLRTKYLLQFGAHATEYNKELFGRYDIHTVWEAANISAGCGGKTVPSQSYLDSIPYTTRDGVFLIPRDYDNYLKIKYKNWHEYPSVERRIQDIQKFCNRFMWYEKLQEKKKK